MANADFINTIQDIRGIQLDINTQGDPDNANLPVTRASGGIWQRLKDKEAKITQLESSSTQSEQQISDMEENIEDIQIDLVARQLDVTNKQTDVTDKHEDVVEKYTDFAGEDGDSGKFKEFTDNYNSINLDKMNAVADNKDNIDSVADNKDNIDIIANDMNSGSSKISEVYAELQTDQKLDYVYNELQPDQKIDYIYDDMQKNILSDDYDTFNDSTDSYIKTAINASADAMSSATDSELIKWEVEALKRTSDSFATELEDTPVKIWSSNGDGTFSSSNTAPIQYSSYHWKQKASGTSGNVDTANMTFSNKNIDDISNFVASNSGVMKVTAIGSSISKGDVVKVNGYDSSGAIIQVSVASSPEDIISGIAREDIAENAEGLITSSGIVVGIDTSSLDGLVYSDGSGSMTSTAPDEPVVLGYVVKKHATLGAIYVTQYSSQSSQTVYATWSDAKISDSDFDGLSINDALSYIATKLEVGQSVECYIDSTNYPKFTSLFSESNEFHVDIIRPENEMIRFEYTSYSTGIRKRRVFSAWTGTLVDSGVITEINDKGGQTINGSIVFDIDSSTCVSIGDNCCGINACGYNNVTCIIATNDTAIYASAPAETIYSCAEFDHAITAEAESSTITSCATGAGAIIGEATLFEGVVGCSGTAQGVAGYSNSIGVYGCAGNDCGVFGRSQCSYGSYGCAVCDYGVYGKASGNYGVYGCATSYGVYGEASCNYGVAAKASNYALHSCATGSYGTYSHATGCYGLYAIADASYGVYAKATTNYGVYALANDFGVYGYATHSNGVYGKTAGSNGVTGYACCNNGVYGYSKACQGVYGQALTCIGVYGYAPNYSIVGCTPGNYAVVGYATNKSVYGCSSNTEGVIGCAHDGNGVIGYAPRYGVHGEATSCIGVYGCAPTYGVYGCATNYGVYGVASCNVGIYGKAVCCGVYGCATTFAGVYGVASCNVGVCGHASCYFGVHGTAYCSAVHGCATCNVGVEGCAKYTGVYGLAQSDRGVYGYAVCCCGVYGFGEGSYGVAGCTNDCYGTIGTANCHGARGYAHTSYPVSGNGAYYNSSDTNLKISEDICLQECLRDIPLDVKKYQWEDGNQKGFDYFVGPMAQDLENTFDLQSDSSNEFKVEYDDAYGVKEPRESSEIIALEKQLRELEQSILSEEIDEDEKSKIQSSIDTTSKKLKELKDAFELELDEYNDAKEEYDKNPIYKSHKGIYTTDGIALGLAVENFKCIEGYQCRITELEQKITELLNK